MEGLDDQPLDWNKILSLQDSNGAFLCSPSSTAYAYLKTKDQKCLKYLISLLDGKNAVSVNTPIEVFEINWCLEIISKLNLNHIFSEEYNKHLSYIFKSWNIEGMSWSTQFNLADLDDTSVSYYLLKQAGHIKVNANIFNRFVENNKIFCFKGELDASPSHILHLIQALQDNQSSDILRLHAIKTILDLTHNNNWKDKWHLSPYYLLHLLIENIGNDNPYYMDIYYKFIRKSQNLDGGWGNKNSNKEETAWACYSLLRIKNFEKLQNFENILKKGIEYLINNKLVKEDNNLWIAKFLFTPYTIIEILKDCVVLSYALRNN